MAFIRPEYNPEEIPHDSEKLVYVALRDQLSDEYVVLHSYPWLRPDRDGALREGEVDFLILHRTRGMLVLEVKGGTLAFRSGRWLREKASGWEPITDPFMQARRNMHAMLDKIEQHSNGDVMRDDFTYGYAVVFPHDDYTGPEPPGADPAIILTSRHMQTLCEAIEAAFAKWPQRQNHLSQYRWGRLTVALLPEFRLFRPVAVDAKALYERIEELTDEQVETFRGLYSGNRRVYINGVAGSGKTRLALDVALSLAKNGKRTLLVCYNRHLAEYLDELVRSSPFDRDCLNQLSIRNFHRLARELIEDAQVRWCPPEAGSGAEEAFFVNEIPDLMEQAALVLIDEARPVQFDAIVMDEAQDFHSRWWEALNYTLLESADDGVFYAFGDQSQRLWDWAPTEPPISLTTRFDLHRNCRNSRWIAKTSAVIAGVQTELSKRLPPGGKPAIDVVPAAAAMKGTVLAATSELLQKHRLLPEQIVLIGPRNLSHGSLANQADILGIPLTDSVTEWRANKGLLVTTARSFKGLEADAVIVYDLDQIGATFTLTDLYVACTRARAYLHFLVSDRGLVNNIRSAIEAATPECAN